MPETTTRTAYLYAAIKAAPRPITTHDAEWLLTFSGFSCHRNSARKSLRTLVRGGLLVAHDEDGRRTYSLNQQRSAAA